MEKHLFIYPLCADYLNMLSMFVFGLSLNNHIYNILIKATVFWETI